MKPTINFTNQDIETKQYVIPFDFTSGTTAMSTYDAFLGGRGQLVLSHLLGSGGCVCGTPGSPTHTLNVQLRIDRNFLDVDVYKRKLSTQEYEDFKDSGFHNNRIADIKKGILLEVVTDNGTVAVTLSREQIITFQKECNNVLHKNRR